MFEPIDVKISLVALLKIFALHFIQIKVTLGGGMHSGTVIEIREILPGMYKPTLDYLLYDLDEQKIIYIDSNDWESLLDEYYNKAKKHEVTNES